MAGLVVLEERLDIFTGNFLIFNCWQLIKKSAVTEDNWSVYVCLCVRSRTHVLLRMGCGKSAEEVLVMYYKVLAGARGKSMCWKDPGRAKLDVFEELNGRHGWSWRREGEEWL